MKSFRLFVRRLSVVAATTAVGSAAVIAFSTTPAYATNATINGNAVCDTTTGNWVITWTVSNTWNFVGTLKEVDWSPTGPTPSGGIVVNATLAKGSPLTGTQTVPGTTTATRATLKVKTHFTNGHTATNDGTAHFQDTCEQDKPKIGTDANSTCETFTIKVSNTGTVTATGTVTSGSKTDNFDLAPAEHVSFSYPGGPGITATVILGEQSDTFQWKNPGDCPTPTTPPPPTTTTPPLPVTGASLTSLVGLGGALILVGAALLFVLRRQRGLSEP